LRRPGGRRVAAGDSGATEKRVMRVRKGKRGFENQNLSGGKAGVVFGDIPVCEMILPVELAAQRRGQHQGGR